MALDIYDIDRLCRFCESEEGDLLKIQGKYGKDNLKRYGKKHIPDVITIGRHLVRQGYEVYLGESRVPWNPPVKRDSEGYPIRSCKTTYYPARRRLRRTPLWQRENKTIK